MSMQWEDIMKTRYAVALSVVAGAALGAAAVQGLHAQAKPKAYTVSEVETINPAALGAFVSALEDAQSAAGGHNLHTRGGRIVTLGGRQLRRECQSSSGTVLNRQKHFTNRRSGTILLRTVRGRSR
jgi:hypothetical protein